MRFSEQNGIVYVKKPGDYQAGTDGDCFKMALYGHLTLLFLAATYTGDAVLTVNSGATDGAKTTAETFHYRYADADQAVASADQFSDWADSASLTLTAATYGDRILIVELDAAELTAGQPFVTVNLSAAADALNVAIVAILSEGAYQMHDMPTAIPTA